MKQGDCMVSWSYNWPDVTIWQARVKGNIVLRISMPIHGKDAFLQISIPSFKLKMNYRVSAHKRAGFESLDQWPGLKVTSVSFLFES